MQKPWKSCSQKSDNIQQTQMNFKNNKSFWLNFTEWKLQIIRNVQQTSRQLLATDLAKQWIEDHRSEDYLLTQQVASLRRQTFRLRMLGKHLSGNKSKSASDCVQAVASWQGFVAWEVLSKHSQSWKFAVWETLLVVLRSSFCSDGSQHIASQSLCPTIAFWFAEHV